MMACKLSLCVLLLGGAVLAAAGADAEPMLFEHLLGNTPGAAKAKVKAAAAGAANSYHQESRVLSFKDSKWWGCGLLGTLDDCQNDGNCTLHTSSYTAQTEFTCGQDDRHNYQNGPFDLAAGAVKAGSCTWQFDTQQQSWTNTLPDGTTDITGTAKGICTLSRDAEQCTGLESCEGLTLTIEANTYIANKVWFIENYQVHMVDDSYLDADNDYPTCCYLQDNWYGNTPLGNVDWCDTFVGRRVALPRGQPRTARNSAASAGSRWGGARARRAGKAMNAAASAKGEASVQTANYYGNNGEYSGTYYIGIASIIAGTAYITGGNDKVEETGFFEWVPWVGANNTVTGVPPADFTYVKPGSIRFKVFEEDQEKGGYGDDKHDEYERKPYRK